MKGSFAQTHRLRNFGFVMTAENLPFGRWPGDLLLMRVVCHHTIDSLARSFGNDPETAENEAPTPLFSIGTPGDDLHSISDIGSDIGSQPKSLNENNVEENQ